MTAHRWTPPADVRPALPVLLRGLLVLLVASVAAGGDLSGVLGLLGILLLAVGSWALLLGRASWAFLGSRSAGAVAVAVAFALLGLASAVAPGTVDDVTPAGQGGLVRPG